MTRLSGLTPREKGLLAAGAAVLAGAAAWLLVVVPLIEQRRALEDRIARYANILNVVDAAPRAGDGAAPACTATGPLAPRVVARAEAAGIALARLAPDAGRLRVTVAETGYADAIAWIADLETRACARATSVEMARLTAPGQVSLRLTLEEAAP